MAGAPYFVNPQLGIVSSHAGSLANRAVMPSVMPTTVPNPGAQLAPQGQGGQSGGGMSASQRPGLGGPQFNPNASPVTPDLGAGRSAIVPARSANRYLGLNTESPPEMLGALETPNAVNVDGIQTPGAIQPRLGLVKCTNAAANSVGIGIVPLLFDISGVAQALMQSEHGSTVQAVSLQPVGIVCNVPPIRSQIPGGTMVVTDLTNGGFSVAITSMPRVGGIEGVIVAWNRRGKVPQSPFQDSVRYSDVATTYPWYGDSAFSSGSIASGSSVTVAVGVAAYVVSRLGRSAPMTVVKQVTV